MAREKERLRREERSTGAMECWKGTNERTQGREKKENQMREEEREQEKAKDEKQTKEWTVESWQWSTRMEAD